MKLLKSIIFMLSLINVQSQPNGHYCTNVMGNTIDIIFNNPKNIANISGNMYGIDLSCKNENYILNKSNILFSNNQSDCLNKVLNKYGLCPCPPDVVYQNSKNDIVIEHEYIIGNITLNKC